MAVERGTPRRPRRLWVLTLVLAASLGPAVPALAGGDCGAADTPPAHHMANGQTCSGSLDGETDVGGGWTERYDDSFTYDATLDDEVELVLTTSNPCIYLTVPYEDYGYAYQRENRLDGATIRMVAVRSGRLSADVTFTRGGFGAAPSPLPVRASAGTAPEPRYHECDGAKTYSLRISVAPNDRPTLSVSGPSTVTAGTTARFVVTVSDPDGNLYRVSANEGAWKYVNGAAATVSFDITIDYPVDILFRVEDRTCVDTQYGTFCAGSDATKSVAATPNDCSSGGDAGTLAVTLPLLCPSAHVFSSGSDTTDAYTFDVSPDATRLWVRFTRVRGYAATSLVLAGPGGERLTATDAGFMVAPVAAGPWRLDVTRSWGWVAYALTVHALGPPAPPVVTGSVDPSSMHEGDATTLTLTTADPNALGVSVSIDWGDGAIERIPSAGTAPAGTITRAHTYWWAKPPGFAPRVAVTVTNEESLSASLQIPVQVTPHDDCGSLREAAPIPGETDPQVSYPYNPPMKNVCVGELGYQNPGGPDAADVYWLTFPLSAWRAERVVFSLEPGGDLVASVAVSSSLQSAPQGGASPSTAAIDPSLPFVRYSVWVRRTSGKGPYTLTMTKEPRA